MIYQTGRMVACWTRHWWPKYGDEACVSRVTWAPLDVLIHTISTYAIHKLSTEILVSILQIKL